MQQVLIAIVEANSFHNEDQKRHYSEYADREAVTSDNDGSYNQRDANRKNVGRCE